MNVTLGNSLSKTAKNPTLVVFFPSSENKTPSLSKEFSKEVRSFIEGELDKGTITGDLGEARLFRNNSFAECANLLLVGLGPADALEHEAIRKAASHTLKALREAKLTAALVDLSSALHKFKDVEHGGRAFIEGLYLTDYDYLDFRPKDRDKRAKFEIVLSPGKLNLATLKKALTEGEITAEGMNLARWMGDTPGNLLPPRKLAEVAAKQARGTKLKVTAWNKARIAKEKMGGLLGVSLGSAEEPRFIIMDYKGGSASQKPLVLVGKGLTFDTGGVSIKPSANMDEMKYDMCGGAAVIAAMLIIAKLKLKVNVVGLVPATENAVGPEANKPGDILIARNGKSVEVLNTDAEGRLILMDALSYACELKPDTILDTATLTGAIIISLGNSFTGVFTRNDKLWSKIKKSAALAGDPVWQMPLTDDHVQDMKGTHAEWSNISSFKGGGSSTAAAFLEQFVDKDIPWAHLDIAGTAWNRANRVPYVQKKGATGAIIRTFVEFAKTY